MPATELDLVIRQRDRLSDRLDEARATIDRLVGMLARLAATPVHTVDPPPIVMTADGQPRRRRPDDGQ